MMKCLLGGGAAAKERPQLPVIASLSIKHANNHDLFVRLNTIFSLQCYLILYAVISNCAIPKTFSLFF